MRAIRVLLVVWVVAGLAFPATAQPATPRPSPPPAQQDTLCDAFTKGANGDWVAKKDVMVPGPELSAQPRAAAPELGSPVDLARSPSARNRLP